MVVLMGIDGGGTFTRVAAADTQGRLLAHVKRQGGAFLLKDANANENVRLTVLAALEEAGCGPSDVIALAAGIAGYDKKRDLRWVRKLTEIEGLRCVVQHANDAVVAHRGALLFRPGIVAIAGTGSIILGITEKGKLVRNYDFRQYVNNSASHLTHSCVERILAGETDDTDFTDKLLRHFGAENINALKSQRQKERKLYGNFAPEVTAAALNGSRIAGQVCERAAEETVEGIRLLGGRFASSPVPVALVGSAANSEFMKHAVGEMLHGEGKFALVEPALPPALGAVLMAAQLAGIEIEPFQKNLIASYLEKGE